MRTAVAVVLLLAGAAASGCGTPGTAEEFAWSIDLPTTVDKGAEFTFVVRSVNSLGTPVPDVGYRYQILWSGGSSNPLRHRGRTGEEQKIHARMTPGPATIVITCENREKLESKVLEATFEVK